MNYEDIKNAVINQPSKEIKYILSFSGARTMFANDSMKTIIVRTTIPVPK